MSDPRAIPAKYDTNRLPNGHFAKGNTAGVSWTSESATKLKTLQAAWFSAGSPGDVAKVYSALLEMCLTCDVPGDRIKAMALWLDRTCGKVMERLAVDIQSDSGPAPILNLRPDQLAVLEEIVQATAPEVIVIPPLDQ